MKYLFKSIFKFIFVLWAILLFVAALLKLFDLSNLEDYYQGLEEGILYVDSSYVAGPARYQKIVLAGSIQKQDKRFVIYEKEVITYKTEYLEEDSFKAQLAKKKSILIPVWFNPKHKWEKTLLRRNQKKPNGNEEMRNGFIGFSLLALPMFFVLVYGVIKWLK